MKLGLLGRFAIVLPPSSVKENQRIVSEIKEKLFFIADNVDFIEDGTVLIYPNEEIGVYAAYNEWYKLPVDKRKGVLKTLPISVYKKLLKTTIRRMAELTNHLPFDKKYLHQFLDFTEDDYNLKLSKSYLQNYLQHNKKDKRNDLL